MSELVGLPGFIAAFALGGAALALWVDARFTTLAPSTMRGVIAHLVSALVLAQLAAFALQFAIDPQAIALSIVAVFLLVLPTLVYGFLAGIWVIKMAQSHLGGTVR